MSHVEALTCIAERLRSEWTCHIDVTTSEEADVEARQPRHFLSMGVELVAAKGPSARSRAAESYRRAAMTKSVAILRTLAEQGLMDADMTADVIQGVGGALDRLVEAVAQDDVYGEIEAIEGAEAILNGSAV